MTYRIETLPQNQSPAGQSSYTDIVIDGFEQGMADSAEKGIQLIKNANIISATGELMVNYKMASVTKPPVISAVSCTFTGATDFITCAAAISAGLVNGMAVYFGSTTGGVTLNAPYWVGNVSGNTFKIYDHVSRTESAVNITDDTNTISTFVIGAMTHHAESWVTNASAGNPFTPQNLFLDSNGRAWWVNASSVLVFLGNTTLTNAGGNGLTVIGGNPDASTPGFLLVFRQSAIDTLPLDALFDGADTLSRWAFDWQTVTGYTGVSHQAMESPFFNGVIFCNGAYAGTIRVIANTLFDPATAASYTYNATALAIPTADRTTWIAALGQNFLIGGSITRIYPWDGIAPSYTAPLILPEPNIQKIISTNSIAYIFTGNRGRIYITNGSNIELFKKFPDQVGTTSIGPDPYIIWGGALYWRNQLYFALQFLTNAGSSSGTQNSGGVWAIDLESNVLRHTNDTFGGSSSTTPVIAPNVSSSTPGGAGLYASSTDQAGTAFYLDVGTTTPYTDGSCIIRTELIPVATFYTNRSFQQIEYKLSRPLVTGESIAIGWRDILSESFTSLTSDSTQVGAMSGTFVSNIDPVQYLQLEAALTSTASTPSFCRLTQIRIR